MMRNQAKYNSRMVTVKITIQIFLFTKYQGLDLRLSAYYRNEIKKISEVKKENK